MTTGAGQKSKDTLAEIEVREALDALGLDHYREHRTIALPPWGNRSQRTTPDVLFEDEKIAVFVDGCYWHGCPVCFRDTRTNTAEWRAKRAQNRARDQRHSRALETLGWRILRVWEHQSAAAAAKAVQAMIDVDAGPGTYAVP